VRHAHPAPSEEESGDPSELALDDRYEIFDHDHDQVEAESGIETGREWIAPVIAGLAIVAWTGFFAWALRGEIGTAATASPERWVGWIGDWAVPTLLICIAYLLIMRNSRAESRRFGNTAAMLSQESARLENRLSTVNRELSLAREFLGEQSRELEGLGRIAGERIGAHAEELQGLIKDNGAQVDAIGTASEAALSNMGRLRDDLPVIANSARDVANRIGSAGRTAQDQLTMLESGLERLETSGQSNEARVAEFDRKVTDCLAGFETTLTRIEQSLSTRYDALQERAGAFRGEADDAERLAIASLTEHLDRVRTQTNEVADTIRQAEAAAIDRFAQSKDRLYEDVSGVVESLDKLDRQAIAASHNRVQQLHDEAARFDQHLTVRDERFVAEISRRQTEFEQREAHASEALAERLSELDQMISLRREAQIAQTEKLVAHSAAIGTQMDSLDALLTRIVEEAGTAREGLTEGLGELGGVLSDKQKVIADSGERLNELTEKSVRLLEIIQSGARFGEEDLGKAIDNAAREMGAVKTQAENISGLMFKSRESAAGLETHLIETGQTIEAADASLSQFKARLAEQAEETLARLNGLRGGFAKLVEQSDAFATGSQQQMRDTLDALENSIGAALSDFETDSKTRVAEISHYVARNAADELERVIRTESELAVTEFAAAAEGASSAGRDATAQLRHQLAKVNELTSNLEQRIAIAREKAEEDVGNEFARRMALITDSLNSNSIDIAAALSSEVTDTAWDAYLKGDRGIFTRRAVRLTNSGTARAIANLYRNDDTFQQSVNRYIHDFEAMLRSMLSTRDGNALGVTMLGSDVGKLYVVLAQALERIRA